jgi:hypothetical protein
MTIDHAIAFGVYAEPTNDLTLPFAFVRRADEIEYVEPIETETEDQDDSLHYILNRI